MKPSYLSRILSGESNLTLKTIARLEIALDKEIITITKGTEYSLEPSVSVWMAQESSIHEHSGFAVFGSAGDPLSGSAFEELTGAVSVNVGIEMKIERKQEEEEREGLLPILQSQHAFPLEMPLA